MYTAFFGLQQEPFSIAPDPRFLYMSDKHREALQLLGYGLTRGASFVLLTGEIGAGKTTVWRRFLEELPSNYDVASVVNPKLDTNALLARVFEDLGVELPADGKAVDLIDALHGHLLLAHAQGRRTLIVIDEAQALSNEVLEQLRLLTNLDSSGRKLQVMLIGQPELRQMLQQPQLEPLAQRVVARYHLPALSASETAGYIAHRLAVAGLKGPIPFDGESLGLIHQLCHGVPRRINVICDRAMSNAQATGSRRVDRHAVERAVEQVYGARIAPAPMSAGAPARDRRRQPVGRGDRRRRRARRGRVAGAALHADDADDRGGRSGGERGLGWRDGDGAAAAPARGGTGPGRADRASPRRCRRRRRPGHDAPTVAPPTATPDATATEPRVRRACDDGPRAGIARQPLRPRGRGRRGHRLARARARFWGAALGPGEPCSGRPRRNRCSASEAAAAWPRCGSSTGRASSAWSMRAAAPPMPCSPPSTANRRRSASAAIETTVPLAELAQVWRGDYATFWRAPPGYREGDITSTAAGSAWLAQRLPAGDGQAAPTAAKRCARASPPSSWPTASRPTAWPGRSP